jgi:hypothetical protein
VKRQVSGHERVLAQDSRQQWRSLPRLSGRERECHATSSHQPLNAVLLSVLCIRFRWLFWRAEEGLGSRDGDGAGDLIRTRGGKGVGHRDTAGYVLRPDGPRKRRQESATDAIIAITRLIARHIIGHSHID